jgi:hypothetical protein
VGRYEDSVPIRFINVLAHFLLGLSQIRENSGSIVGGVSRTPKRRKRRKLVFLGDKAYII